MIQIRRNCFETNSSSCHCIVILTEDQFKKWEDGLAYVNYDDEFVTEEEARKMYDDSGCKEENIPFKGYVNDCFSELWDYDSWHEELEHDVTEYTSPSGDKLVICCAHGYDG